jgi:hypothetical protein
VGGPQQSRILVIHGVSVRDEDEWMAQLPGIATALRRSRDDFIPVFWGDLAPNDQRLLQSIPSSADVNDLPAAPGAGFLPEEAPSWAIEPPPPDAANELASRTIGELAIRTGEEPPPETQEVIRSAVSQAEAEGLSFALASDLAEPLAAMVQAESPTDSAFIDVPFLDGARDRLLQLMRAFDREAGKRVGDALQNILRGTTANLSGTIARTVGDVLLYTSAGAQIRGRLDQAYRKARGPSDAPNRVHILAHSLGSIVAVEWLLGAPASVDEGQETNPEERVVETLVTFGAQVGLLAELRGLVSASGHIRGDPPLQLPIRVTRWVNIWNQIDPLAYVFGRSLTMGGDRRVEDFRERLDSIPTSAEELWMHSGYLQRPPVASWLAEQLD